MALLTRVPGNVFFISINCCTKLIFNYSKIEFYKKNSQKILTLSKYVYNIRFLFTDLPAVQKRESKYIMYDEFIENRRLQARRSVLIEIQSYKSCSDVYKYCSEFGQIKNIFYYTDVKALRHFVFIEFEHQKLVDKIMSTSTHLNLEQIIPVQSSNLWFRKVVNDQCTKKVPINSDELSLEFIQHSYTLINDAEIIKALGKIKQVSQQILSLYKTTKLTDADVRLRFYTAYQFERSFHGLFPNIAILPFGSSVNGFGIKNCDLDLTLIFEKEKADKSKSRLVFHTKHFSIIDKQRIKNLMEVIADMMNTFIPGVHNIKKILEAKVPIIKFDYKLTGIECDLSVTNRSGYYMSELLYIYGEIDKRVKPLIFTIRKWAKSNNLTKDIAGPWITNFSLTLMVLFFFQQQKILPTLDLLQSRATKNDVRLVESHIDCTFQRDINQIPKSDFLNEETLEKLLLKFFSYYSKFDFEKNAISLNKGTPILKPERSALYICNPFQISLNVSKNVKYEEIHRVRYEMRNALWIMENDDKFKNSGLINLIFNKNKSKGSMKTIDIKMILKHSNSLV